MPIRLNALWLNDNRSSNNILSTECKAKDIGGRETDSVCECMLLWGLHTAVVQGVIWTIGTNYSGKL